MSNETWKPVVGFDGYEVSDLGNVRSWRLTGKRTGMRAETPKALRPLPNRGYFRVALSAAGKPHYRSIHRLVLEAFVGPCPEDMEGCHDNGNPADNRLENLRWDTRVGNFADKVRHGTLQEGERQGSAKLTLDQVQEIRNAYGPARGVNGSRPLGAPTCAELAHRYGVSPVTISRVVRNANWRNKCKRSSTGSH